MIIEIDTEKETIPSIYAQEQGISMPAVSALIKRGKLRTRYIEELKLMLVIRNSEPEERLQKRERKKKAI